MATAPLATGIDAAAGDAIAVLHRFALDIVATSNLNELLKSALLAVAQLTGATHATVLLLDDQGEQIRYRVALDNGNLAPLELVAGPMMSRGLAGWVTREREAVLVPDTEQDVRWLPGPGLGDLRSAIVAPLLCHDRVLGIITLGHEASGHFTAQHLRLLQVVCAPVALAVDQAQGDPVQIDVAQAPPEPDEKPSVRVVVALSAVLRGLTGAAASLSPEALFDDVLDVYFQTIGVIVREHEGVLDSIAGDTLLAIFSRPEAPIDGVRAALAMRAAAQQMCADWRARHGISMGCLDIGIARGIAAIGGRGARHGAIGEVINVAARLRELARSGEILVSSAVAADLEVGEFTVQALQPLRLHDSAPQQIFRIGARI